MVGKEELTWTSGL